MYGEHKVFQIKYCSVVNSNYLFIIIVSRRRRRNVKNKTKLTKRLYLLFIRIIGKKI